jgi:uncharacterized protein YjhX (UPF0386 family)
MTWEIKQLLIWGTTYPEFSKTYYETICTGAIDMATGKLVRIYPITLRYMHEPFKRYDIIEAEAERNISDFRPESFKIKQDSIRVIGNIEIQKDKDGWRKRSEAVLRDGNVFPSVAALQAAELDDHTSLGLVRPGKVLRIYAERRSNEEREEWDKQREAALSQRDLFVDAETKTKDLVFIPVRYKIRFTCEHSACATEHDMSILDWGTYVLSRKMFAQKGPVQAERDVIAKIEELMDCTKRIGYLFLGNTKAHSRNFMVVGFFTPPHEKQKANQLSMF